MLWGTIRDAASADQRTPEQLRNEAVAQIPLGRMAQPDDIAHAFLFLASEASAHVTGVTVPVDGGRLLV
jgi:NAD(P)-dependent dehydrogenase (short-subunit alcohol dehydrogenase family)